MRLRRPLVLLAITAVAAGQSLCAPASASAAAPAPYTITDIGVLPGGAESHARAINNAGAVAGWSDDGHQDHAIRWANGVLTNAGDPPGAPWSQAWAINDSGQLGGITGRTTGGYEYPARWASTGGAVDLGGPVTNALGAITSINRLGEAAGGQRPANSEGSPEGGVYAPDGHRTDFGAQYAMATGINDRGQVVGPGYVWENGAVTNLTGFAGAGTAAGTNAINLRGQIVGSAFVNGVEHPALWRDSHDTNPVDLGLINTSQFTVATAVNIADEVVGTSDPKCSPCETARAWLWRAGAITPLDQLIPAGTGWSALTEADGINDQGQIVGAGIHNGAVHGFVMTPAVHINVNFGPAGAAVPTGYVADTGAIYGDRGHGLVYGWNTDNSAWTRDRNAAAAPDQRYDTLIHLQKPGGARTWEVAVPNGRYLVHLVAGDPAAFDSTFRLRVEDTVALSGTPSSASPWVEATVVVTVSDGRLTVGNATNSSNDKLNYVDIMAD
jgi:probable HAF family extracellular repeat protein